ncbi:MAG TPA: hypothetical protein VFB41_07430 [Solirubrobacteraceae bacterium]|nr:hypothetical protein [Solirubrobacteraceae bacterium]
MLADVGTAALIVAVVLLATLLPMYAKWRAMQALVDRLARRARPPGPDPPHDSVTDSSDDGH